MDEGMLTEKDMDESMGDGKKQLSEGLIRLHEFRGGGYGTEEFLIARSTIQYMRKVPGSTGMNRGYGSVAETQLVTPFGIFLVTETVEEILRAPLAWGG